jgi:hypothetical protein
MTRVSLDVTPLAVLIVQRAQINAGGATLSECDTSLLAAGYDGLSYCLSVQER